MKSIIGSLYLSNRLLIALGCNVGLFILGFVYIPVFALAKVSFLIILAILVVDFILLYPKKNAISGTRVTPEKFSNGDQNEIKIKVTNNYGFKTWIKIIDEFPVQFQFRDTEFEIILAANEVDEFCYDLRPTERGEYHFGKMNCFVRSPLGFVARRHVVAQEQMVPVYPSFLQLRKYELLAFSDRLTEVGVKKIRKIGQNTEFDQIREYVRGDDYRTINWKATARRGDLMVNQYQDEKSQSIYSLVDKGRAMKMPFDGLTLVDYAINASLVMSNIAINKDDKAGLITFSNRIGSIIKDSNRKVQMHSIMEALYSQQTRFQESDFGRLYRNIKWNITRRSLLMLYTNFESLVALQRQIKYLRAIAKDHLLVVVFFENTELKELTESHATSTQGIYARTIAEKFTYEKKMIVKELQKYGIHSILTTPENLTISSINKYLELKSRGMI